MSSSKFLSTDQVAADVASTVRNAKRQLSSGEDQQLPEQDRSRMGYGARKHATSRTEHDGKPFLPPGRKVGVRGTQMDT
ncbi:hypothetical protein HZ326_24820 [Fusarium oxysporum f. sp. albedinis]|nr:hypothetical protein HZ326_24820 [Fusarium oxysporum f. sp. albedinis]